MWLLNELYFETFTWRKISTYLEKEKLQIVFTSVLQ